MQIVQVVQVVQVVQGVQGVQGVQVVQRAFLVPVQRSFAGAQPAPSAFQQRLPQQRRRRLLRKVHLLFHVERLRLL